MIDVKRKYSRVLAFLVVVFITKILSICVIIKVGPKYDLAYTFLFMLVIALSAFFIFKNEYILFEPIFLFSVFYTTVLLAGFYSLATDFRYNVFVQNTTYYNDLGTLTAFTSFYFFSGYIFTLMGYYLIKKKKLMIEFKFELKSEISDVVLNIVIVSLVSIGIINFLYNIMIFAGGSFFLYMSNVSLRFHEFATTGTTLGYTLAYNAMYLWFYKIFRKGKELNNKIIFFLIITIIMKASTGRIFGTLLYTASFFGLYYFFEIHNTNKIKNFKYYILAILLLIAGVLFYFLRIISSLSINNLLKDGVKSELSQLFKSFLFLAVDSGNIPNYGLVLKIVDSWEYDIGFLYGESLITWVFGFLPSFIRPGGYQPSVIIKNVWYSHVPVGNLPPTGIGEMYANFGVLGPFLGMFLFGCLIALLYNITLKSKNYWIYVIYIQISIGFVMLYPKGEFDNLSLWMIIPILFLITVIKIVSFKNNSYKISYEGYELDDKNN